jgi:hypothetical protein
MKVTHNPKAYGKRNEPHSLALDPVPLLPLGAKPAKPNDGGSTRTDSPTPTTPTTPIPGTPLTQGSPYMPRRLSPPPSSLTRRSVPVEEAPSETPIVEEPTGVEESTKKTKEPTSTKESTEKNKESTTIKEHTEKKEEQTVIESPIAKTENNGDKKDEPLKPTESTPTTLTVSIPAPVAPMFSSASSTLPAASAAPTLKRAAPPTPLILTPDAKRTKLLTMAETRRQLEVMKARREAVAKKRRDLDAELEPYRAQMREEQERLARELEEETRMWKEERQTLMEDAAILVEMKKMKSGK